ncbi:MAG: hypothetical protein Q9160_001724 [Pyrenula sp. 1 TL-2023]
MNEITQDSASHQNESGDEENELTTAHYYASDEEESVVEVEPINSSIGEPPKPATGPAKPQTRKPPKISVGRLNHRHLDELFKSLNTTRGNRQFFDTKVDECTAAIKADQSNGEIRRGQPQLFYAAQDFTKAYGQHFWSFLEPEVDDDELHVKVAQYLGDKNALYRSKKVRSGRDLKRKSNNIEPQPLSTPKAAQNPPKRAKASAKDTKKLPPTNARNEDVESEGSEGEDAQTKQTDENRQRSISRAVSVITEGGPLTTNHEPPAATVDEELQPHDHMIPTYEASDEAAMLQAPITPASSIPFTMTLPPKKFHPHNPAIPPSTIPPTLQSSIDLRIKLKHHHPTPTPPSRARTKVPFPPLSTYDTFFPGIVAILSERHQQAAAAAATAGEIVYSWDEENALEMRSGEVGDWNAFVEDLEERWRGGKGEGSGSGSGRVKVYFDLRG